MNQIKRLPKLERCRSLVWAQRLSVSQANFRQRIDSALALKVELDWFARLRDMGIPLAESAEVPGSKCYSELLEQRHNVRTGSATSIQRDLAIRILLELAHQTRDLALITVAID
jgi:hypothetical protein